jgi:four helix bundle protein
MDSKELIERTKRFAVRIIKLAQHLEKGYGNTGRKLGDQLLRSGTGIYGNYRAACRCKSAKDFIHKMGTVVEECDETVGWLELLIAAEILSSSKISDLLKEANELTAIMASSRGTAIKNHPN